MSASHLRRLSPRREIAAALVLGVAGAGLVFLAVRQGWAQVRTVAPAPLPGADVRVTGQDLVPAAAALAVAALASLAALLATRGLVRRLVGLALAGFGVGIAGLVSLRVTAADVIAAASGGAGWLASTGSQGTAGSVTGGGVQGAAGAAGQGGGAPPIAGSSAHVVMTSLPWSALALAGAAAIVVAGLLAAWRASRWPVMSSRFDAPGRDRPRPAARAALPRPAARAALPGPAARAAPPGPAARAALPGPAAGAALPGPAARDTATIWESLSRGEDPTDAQPG
jgi:uncharacterized membrane protein (TIGR02234 family)